LLFVICFICFFQIVSAQSEKKAVAYAEKSLAEWAGKQYTDACATMELAIANDLTNADYYSRLGQWYFEAHSFGKAAETFKTASVKCSNAKLRFAKPLTKSLIYAGRADEALHVIDNYATIRDSTEWNQLRRHALFVKEALPKGWGVWPQNLGIRINTADPELFPSMAVDTSTLFLTRRMANIDEDLFYAKADSCGGWFKALNMGTPTNSTSMESSQFVSSDGHYLFFTRCDNRSENGWEMGGCDMYMAYRVAMDSGWTQPQPFGKTINTPDYEGMPSVSPDNRELYFVSDRKGGYGGYDIWYSKFDNGLWHLPVNAGPGVNTAGNETTPYIATDNSTLFFASDTRPGFGGTDIFVSRRKKDGKWEAAENLGYPINTAHDEKSEYVSLDGRSLFFASDRSGPAGNYDIYQTPLPAVVGATPMSYLQGIVVDSISRARLNYARIEILNAATGEKLYELRSNRGDASYIITLEPGKTYVLNTARTGYQDTWDTVVLGLEYLSKPLTFDIAMLTLNYNPLKPINDTIIGSVHFDVNVTELSAEDRATLKAIMAPWMDEKDVEVSVNAYTDNTGTPMINETLSFKRAAIIAKEILLLGFEEGSVTAKGWGEANAIATNDTEEGRYANRRVEITVKRY
jgi:outer membrane protein OmpA-like peptidoglycan-associated protein/Tol biopolymer transport system component